MGQRPFFCRLVPIRGTKRDRYFLKADHVYFPKLFAGHLYLVAFYVKFAVKEDHPVLKMFRFVGFSANDATLQ